MQPDDVEQPLQGQGMLARALDTDCEHCLDIRRKLFGTTFIPEKDRKAEQMASHQEQLQGR